MKSLSTALDFILDFIFPSDCVNCGAYTDGKNFICRACYSGIEIFSGMFCGKCKARIPDKKKICHKNTPFMLAAATKYEGAVKNMIHGLKFKNLQGLSNQLSEILFRYAKQEGLAGDVIIPIPLGKQREKERGYNQAALLAKALSLHTGIPVSESLRRIKETKPQTQMKTREERLDNLADSFEATEALRGKSVILVDDVTTSGSTFFSASQALKKAGAKRVYALAVSRA